MRRCQTLPAVWLLTDTRNDVVLERVLRRLPRGSGLVFRHYHLPADARKERYAQLARIARARGHWVVLADSPQLARRWRADGIYGAAPRLHGAHSLIKLATVHSLRELAASKRARCEGLFLSPVFATRSHPGADGLGPIRFRLLAAHAGAPVIALGGMNRRQAARLRWHRWGAIDGLG